MNLNSLSDEALHANILGLAREERRLQIEVLHHLREIERRMLFAKRGHPSLFEYCIGELGYTRASAQRRIDSMRLLRHVPEMESRLAEGSISLTHLADAQTFFRKEEIRDADRKKKVLEQLVGQSVLEAQRTLMSLTDQPEQHIPERARAVSVELTEIRFVVDQKTLAQLEELKALLSHARPRMGFKEALEYGLELALAKHRAREPKQKSLVPVPVLKPESASLKKKVIPAALRRRVYRRDDGACTYVHSETGRRCGSRSFLELDHWVPRAQGGLDTFENLRLRCRAHNQLAAIETLGMGLMTRYLPSLRSTLK